MKWLVEFASGAGSRDVPKLCASMINPSLYCPLCSVYCAIQCTVCIHDQPVRCTPVCLPYTALHQWSTQRSSMKSFVLCTFYSHDQPAVLVCVKLCIYDQPARCTTVNPARLNCAMWLNKVDTIPNCIYIHIPGRYCFKLYTVPNSIYILILIQGKYCS